MRQSCCKGTAGGGKDETGKLRMSQSGESGSRLHL